MEAMDTSVPLLERLRFMAIYSSNLDEFFRVRVSSIRNLIRIGKKKINQQVDINPQELISEIHETVSAQLEEYGATYQEIKDKLKAENIFICSAMEEIPEALHPELLHYFKTQVAAYIKLSWVQDNEELFLNNQAIYLAVRFSSFKIAVLNIPTQHLPRFYKAQVGETDYFVFLDDVLRMHLDILFKHEEVAECHAIKLNKDADLQIDDEFEGDLVKKIERQIQRRNLGTPSRFLYDGQMSKQMLDVLTAKLRLSPEDIITGARYHNLNDLFEVSTRNAALEYPKRAPVQKQFMQSSRSILEVIEQQDVLLHFPYQSYDYILQFFNEAAVDPEVQEINVTFYRMAKASIIGEALISAAENGKKVIAFMEVKARFDEENNLEWAKKMKAAGIKIFYSLPGLKVHAKVALVKKRDKMYGFYGTGNLNEKTSQIYCDHGLLTTNKEMNRELSYVFQFLQTRYTPPPFKHLIVSQFGALEKFHALIDREIANVEAGKEGRIIVKVNNLEERSLINKLYMAAEKGVDVKLIVRSICCLVPNKHLKVKRIVDRYLEHARIFYCLNDGNHDIFLGSSDWMNRNLHHRIEVCFPVQDDDMKQELLTILKFQWRDDEKGVWLSEKLTNKRNKKEYEVRAQEDTYQYLLNQ